jgi:hypothetical protein
MRRTYVLTSAVMAVAVTWPAIANAAFFKTPSENIACGTGPDALGPYAVACTAFSEANGSGQKIWAMKPRREVRVFRSQSNAAFEVPVLGYGETYRGYGITCVSRKRGLRCRNRSNLARERQRVF